MTRKCAVCRLPFEPTKPMQSVCGYVCALELAAADRAKAEKVAKVKDRRETKAKLEKLKSKSQWAKDAQASINAFIRERDADLPCISCGRHHQGQYHAGHYLSRGAHPELAYMEDNLAKQCQPCNTHLSGNQINFRKGLIERIGLDRVEWLEGPHELPKLTIDDLKALKAMYTAKTKELKDEKS